MCSSCSQCQKHLRNPDMTGDWTLSCSDLCGSNASLMSGYASIARGIAIAAEYHREAPPHTRGLAALSIVYSHSTLPVIVFMLEENIRDARHDLVEGIECFMNHVERSSFFNVCDPNNNLDHIEKVSQAGDDEQMDPSLRWLSFRPIFCPRQRFARILPKVPRGRKSMRSIDSWHFRVSSITGTHWMQKQIEYL